MSCQMVRMESAPAERRVDSSDECASAQICMIKKGGEISRWLRYEESKGKTHLVLVVIQRLDTFFFLDIPELYQSIRRGRHELLTMRQKIDSEHRVRMSLKRLNHAAKDD